MSEQPSIEELRAEIAATRDDLINTVEQLSDKLDVKARAVQKAQDVSDSIALAARQTAGRAAPAARFVKDNQAAVAIAATAALALLLWRVRRASS